MSGAAVERYSVGLVYDEAGVCVQRVGGSPPRAGSVHERYRHVVLAAAHDAAIAALTAELQQCRQQWRPIATAPKDGTEFQAWMHNAYLPTGWWEPRCRFNDFGAFQVWQRVDYDDDGFDAVHATPTHWMPLPPAPEAALKERT